jgi:Tfp pilus assembly protein PilE
MLVTAIKAIVFVVCFGVTMGVVYPSYEEKKAHAKKEKKKAACMKEDKQNVISNS